MTQKKILFVYAHPDDESFGNAGTIAKYTTENNAAAYVAVATKGEAGKLGNPPLTSRKNLGNYREIEMKQAAKKIGIQDIFFLGFIDGTLDTLSTLDGNRLVHSIVSIILNVRPDILITFPEDGISLHKDHIAMHTYCLRAIESVKNQYTIPKIYYTVVPNSLYLFRGKPDQGVPDDYVTTKIDIKKYRINKYEALLEYKTQIFSLNKVFPGLVEQKNPTLIYPYEHLQLISLYGKSVDYKSYRELSLLDHL